MPHHHHGSIGSLPLPYSKLFLFLSWHLIISISTCWIRLLYQDLCSLYCYISLFLISFSKYLQPLLCVSHGAGCWGCRTKGNQAWSCILGGGLAFITSLIIHLNVSSPTFLPSFCLLFLLLSLCLLLLFTLCLWLSLSFTPSIVNQIFSWEWLRSFSGAMDLHQMPVPPTILLVGEWLSLKGVCGGSLTGGGLTGQ